MIKKVDYERIICDGCGDNYMSCRGQWMFADAEYIALKYGGWVKDGNKHYCKSCAEIRGIIE